MLLIQLNIEVYITIMLTIGWILWNPLLDSSSAEIEVSFGQKSLLTWIHEVMKTRKWLILVHPEYRVL